MPDPGQLHARFLAGPTLVASKLDVNTDLMVVVLPNATITPAAFYTATSGGGGTPAWVTALQALVASPSDLLFAYNFASGGTGQGWDGTNNVTLTVGQTWEAPFWSGAPFDPANIIDGLGLQQSTSSNATILTGILPEFPDGATILLAAQTYVPVTLDSNGAPLFHMVDSPGDNFEGGASLRWNTSVDEGALELENGNGSGTDVDTISKTTALRGSCNYLTDGSDIVGSLNGRANTSRSGSVVGVAPNCVTIGNHTAIGDAPVYLTLVALFALQSPTVLPTLSAL